MRSAVNRMVEGSNPSCPANFASVVVWELRLASNQKMRVRSPPDAPIPLPWGHYGDRAVAFTLGITSRLERVFYFQDRGNHLRRALLINQPDGPDPF